jgi:pimeloyl-ACP methyl ester carboxylesterase
MLIFILAAALALLAIGTQVGVVLLERAYPPQGQFVDVKGGRLHFEDIGPRDAPGLPVVMIHGASSSLETMRIPLGNLVAKKHRVILFDRPGHGWSTRDSITDASLASQGGMIDEALGKIGISRAVFVGHSWAGALMPHMALTYPRRVAGLVMLSPVAYPWRGGVGFFNELATQPVIGPLLAYTIVMPSGLYYLDAGVQYVFGPQPVPPHYIEDTAVRMVLRPRVFLDNAWDLVTLKAQMVQQSPNYPQIKVPVTIITGDSDTTVSPEIHSRPFAAAVSGTKLIVLPNVGHMPQVAAPDLIVSEIEAMEARLTTKTSAAAN